MVEERSKWIIRLEMDPEEMLERNITMDDVHFAIKGAYADQVNCVYSDYNEDKLVFRLRFQNVLKKRVKINIKKLIIIIPNYSG